MDSNNTNHDHSLTASSDHDNSHTNKRKFATKIGGAIALICCITQICFQLGLALGMPWSAIAYGGGDAADNSDKSLSLSLRITSLVAVFMYAWLAVMVYQRSFSCKQFVSPVACTRNLRFYTTFMFVEVILNWMTTSTRERNIWGPFCTIFFVSLVALSWQPASSRGGEESRPLLD